MTQLQVVFIVTLPRYEMLAAQTHLSLPYLPRIKEGICFEIDGTLTPELPITGVTYRIAKRGWVEINVDGTLLNQPAWLDRLEKDPDWGTKKLSASLRRSAFEARDS